MSVSPGSTKRERLTRAQGTRVVVTARDRELLKIVTLHRAVTGRQLMQLASGFHSRTALARRLRLLYDAGYLRRCAVPADGYASELLHSLGMAAIDEMATFLDQDRAEILRVTKSSVSALNHALGVNDIRIAFAAGQRDFRVRWVTEPQARHVFSLRNGTADYCLKPDGVVLLDDRTERHVFFIEHDKGTVSRSQFRELSATYRTYFDIGMPASIYGATAQPKLLAVVDAGVRRQRELIRVAASERITLLAASLEAVKKEGPYAAIWNSSEGANLCFLAEVVS